MTKVSVLIPVYKVSDTIDATLKAVMAKGVADEIIVVDDCCPENSGEAAQRPGVTVMKLSRNLGKGGALTEAFKRSTGDIIVLLDGDLGASAGEYDKLLPPIADGDADMTIARFKPASKKGGFGFAKGLASSTIKLYTGLEMVSPMSGQRAMTRRVAESLGHFESGWGIETAMTIDVFRMGFKVIEVPTEMTHSETGRDMKGFLHRFGQFKAVFRVMLTRLVFRRRPAV